jgi:cytochrome P450
MVRTVSCQHLIHFAGHLKFLHRAITQNPDVYDDPQSFRPERFIDGNPLDAKEMVFGFGRR